ncbi:MAG: hypothetical protein MJ241_03335 [Bacilli bacterium]|nr:hypothetical protein [Bacilli bacterium]
MGKFIKNFGLGLLYFIALPLLIVGVVCFAVYGIGEYLFYFFKGIVRFFKGDTFFEELPEDAKVKEIKRKLQEQAANPNPQPAPAQQTTTSNVSNQDNSQQSTYNVTNNYYGTPMGPQANVNPQFSNPNPRIDMNATEIDASYRNNAELSEPSFEEIGMNETPRIGTQGVPQIESIDLLDEEGK